MISIVVKVYYFKMFGFFSFFQKNVQGMQETENLTQVHEEGNRNCP